MASGIGDTLRATRRQQRLSLAEAAAEIRVREPYLAALEEEKFNKLGGDVYVRAFLRGYSEFLGLDPDQVVEAYRREFERGARPQHDQHELPADAPTAALPATTAPAAKPPAMWEDADDYEVDEPRESFFPRAVVLAGVVLLMLVVAVLALRQRDSTSAAVVDTATPTQGNVVIPTPEAAATMTAPAEQPTVEPTIEPAVPPPAPTPEPPAPSPQGPLTEVNVQLSVTDGPSWLRATVDGTVAEVGIFEPGTTFTWTAEESVVLRIGDASNVRILLNGVDQGVLGGEREPRDLEYRLGEEPA